MHAAISLLKPKDTIANDILKKQHTKFTYNVHFDNHVASYVDRCYSSPILTLLATDFAKLSYLFQPGKKLCMLLVGST